MGTPTERCYIPRYYYANKIDLNCSNMTVDMDFSGSVGEWQRNLSERTAGKSWRLAVIEAIDV